MEPDSDEDWYDDNNFGINRRNTLNHCQDSRTFYERHENWFRDGLEINDYEYFRTDRTVNAIPFTYRDIFQIFDESKYAQEPEIYKKCTVKIISGEEAICYSLEERTLQIYISGRASCGQAYSEDIVYVKLSHDGQPAPDGKHYGEIVSVVERRRFPNIQHPVFVCLMDPRQYHLMIPVCKTVPKINILHGRLQTKYPHLVRSRVEVHKHDINTMNLTFNRYHKVNEGDKENWLFVVVLIKWKLTNIYPLGAVIGVVHSSQCIEEGLAMICMQNKLPLWSDYIDVIEIRNVVDGGHIDGYQDMSETLRVFTISEGNSDNVNFGFSIETFLETTTRIGVHIADIGRVVMKNGDIDLAAKSRGFFMKSGVISKDLTLLPGQLITLCSIVPGRKRCVFSVFLEIKSLEDAHVENPNIKKTIIKANQNFSFTDVEGIIKSEESGINLVNKEIKYLHILARKLRKKRLHNAAFASPVRVDLSDICNSMGTIHARSLVEELVILANEAVWNVLSSDIKTKIPVLNSARFNDDDIDEIQKWYSLNKYYAHLIVGLQNETVPHIGKLSYRKKPIIAPLESEEVTGNQNSFQDSKNVLIPINKVIFDQICTLGSAKGDVATAFQLIGSDYLHPKQALALHDWTSIKSYRRFVVARPECRKNRCDQSISLTNPFGQYYDHIIQRLLHTSINGEETPYDDKELGTICSDLNKMLKTKDKFKFQCKDLLMGEFLKDNPVIFQCFIGEIFNKEFNFYIPGFIEDVTKIFTIKYNVLDICSAPEMMEDNGMIILNDISEIDEETENKSNHNCNKRQKVILKWRKRIYSFGKSICPRPLLDGREVRHDGFINVYPYHNTAFVKYDDWVRMLEHVFGENGDGIIEQMSTKTANDWKEELNRNREGLVGCLNCVDDVSSEVVEPLIIEQSVPFRMSFEHGQIVSIQMSSQEIAGVLSPVPQILILTDNIKLCLPHVEQPIKTLLRYATKSSLQKYKHPREYKETWLPIVEMESTYTAVHGEESAVINEVPVRFKENQGMFELDQTFCDKRDLNFGYIPDADKPTKDKIYHKVPSGNFLCIMSEQELDKTAKDKMGFPIPFMETYIWNAHAVIIKICKYTKSETEYTAQGQREMIRVVFQLHENSCLPPVQDVQRCRIEMIHKSTVDRRLETHLKKLQHATDLAKNIAVGTDINIPDREHFAVAEEIIEGGLDVGMWPNNDDQRWAIRTCLQRRFKLIQGPPGTGKTYTGVKLIYLFNKFNNMMKQRTGQEKKNQIIFCGPSNRSVDLVARLVVEKLGDKAPRIVRIYGSAYEQLDFPIPGRASVSRRSLHDAKPDPELVECGVVLHHIIRDAGKPYAESLRELDEQFKTDIDLIKSNEDRSQIKTSIDDIKKYKDLVSKASKEELSNYDVIFCTTSLVANPKVLKATDERVYQLIIDEAGMCSEPASIVPIIATQAKQVVLIGDHKQLRPIIKCKDAAKLGLDQSLFERYSESLQLKTMLKWQYRMHPCICEFPSKHFYNGELKTALGTGQSHTPLGMWPLSNEYGHFPHVFCHVSGEEETLAVKTEAGNENSRCNQQEVEQMLKVLKHMTMVEKVPIENINIMSQYNAQCSSLRQALDSNGYSNYTVSTVVSSQGGEWDYVIFSLVRSLPDYLIQKQPTKSWCLLNLGFITDQNQINVALTRAKKGLVIIGNRNLLVCDPVWKELLHDYEKKGCIFDGSDFPK